jgi:uncharacterized protein
VKAEAPSQPSPVPRGRAVNAQRLRVGAIDWPRLSSELDERGYAVATSILSPNECAALIALYDEESRFRSRVVMVRHNFGRGEYQYFCYPLPESVASLRETLYPPLAAIANRWSATLGLPQRFPENHAAFLQICHGAGQTRPTPLLLKYGEGDYNRLHQDLYGEHVFPLQATVLLSPPSDFTGGEFVLLEQRPRTQSRAEVVPLGQGDAVIFAVNHRPEPGARGFRRVALRHGVSRLRSGRRLTLGIIFHDAR